MGGLVAFDFAFQGFVRGREGCYAWVLLLMVFRFGARSTLFRGCSAEGRVVSVMLLAVGLGVHGLIIIVAEM